MRMEFWNVAGSFFRYLHVYLYKHLYNKAFGKLLSKSVENHACFKNFLGKLNNKTLFCLLSICGNQVAEGVVELWAF